MAAIWDGELTRTWQFDTADGVTHVVHLYHDTVTGVRSAMLDFDEIPVRWQANDRLGDLAEVLTTGCCG